MPKPPRIPPQLPVLAALVAVILGASAATASPPSRLWAGPFSGLWSLGANWNPIGIPVAGDSVVVPLSVAAHTVTMDMDSPGLSYFQMLTPTGSIDLGGHTLSAGLSTIAGSLLASGANQTIYGALNTLGGSQTALPNGSILSLNNDWQNDGHVLVHSTAGSSPSILRIFGYQTLSGSGDIQLGDATNALFDSPSAYTLTQNAGHRIHGAGHITLPFTNHGTVTADAAGTTLSIDNANISNDGTLRATGTGSLQLNGNVANTNGLLLADGGNIELNGSSIANGLFHTTGSSVIETKASSTIGGAIGFTGNMQVNSGHVLAYSGGTLADSGQVLVHPSGAGASSFRLNGYLTLDGPGNVKLNDGTLALFDSPSNYTLTQNAAHTVRGAGIVSLPVTNHGLISADLSGQTLTITNSVVNDGTLQAVSGGTLALQSNTIGNTGTVAASGGNVLLTNETITGGTVQASGANLVTALAGTSHFNNVSTSGTVQVSSGAILTTQGTIANSGVFQVRPPAGSSTATLRLLGYATYQGGGSIQLTHATQSVFDSPSAYTVTQNAGHTLHGTGQVTLPVTNHGLVSADVAGQPLTMTNTIANDAILQATSGGVLVLQGSTLTNTGGTIKANNGGVQMSGENVLGGTLSRAGTSVVAITGNSRFTSVTSSALVQVNGGSTLTVNGTFPNTGNYLVHQPSGVGLAAISLDSYATFSGAGAIQLADSALAAIVSPSGYTLTNAAGHTVHGTGATTLPVTNHGLVSADVSGQPLMMSNTIANDGLLQATGGGLLHIGGGSLINTGGTVAATGGDVRLTGEAFYGGTFTSTGGNSVVIDANSSLTSDILNKSRMRVNGGVTLTIGSVTLTDSATVQLRTPGDTAAAAMNLTSYAHFVGNGAVVLTHGTQSTIGSVSGYTLYNDAPHTIRGTGTLTLPFTNSGTLVADVTDSALTVAHGTLTLTGIQAAANGGKLLFVTNTPNYSGNTLVGGTWQAGANSRIQFPAVDIRHLAAQVVLDGAGSDLVSADSSVTALRRLAGVDLNGGLTVRNGRLFGTPAGLTCSGVVGVGPHSVLTIGSAGAGNFSMDTSTTFVVEISGRSAGGWGRVNVNGNLIVNGHLRIRVLDGFVPVLTDTFEVMNYTGSRAGDFAMVDSQVVAPHIALSHIWRDSRMLIVAHYVSAVTDVPPGTPAGSTLPNTLAFSARGGQGGKARLELALPSAAAVDVSLFDVSGRRVATLARESFAAGRWSWNVDAGREQSTSGVYFARARVTMNGETRDLVSRLVIWR